MVLPHQNYDLREHLAVISTEAYLLLRATDERERIQRYRNLQQAINAILALTNPDPPENQPPEDAPG